MGKKLTKEEFVRRSIEINGEEHYSYDNVIYKTTVDKVQIHCNIHNIDFEQTPEMHMYQKGGCPICARESTTNSKIKGKQHNIELIFNKFGDLYNYENAPDDITFKQKFDVICKRCGNIINTSFNNLLKCKVCKICYPRKNTYIVNSLETFINYCNVIHDSKYDYSKVEYVNNYTKVIIGCTKHKNYWEVLPNSHMKGVGCKICANEIISKKLTKNFDVFLEEFREVHGDEFDYSRAEYKGTKEPILIICKNGHELWQAPQKHAEGAKCSYCLGRHKTTEEFIQQGLSAHNGKYTYDKTVYVNNHQKVIVTCPDHGDFKVSPSNHIKPGQGRGCPKCSNSRGEVAIESYLLKSGINHKQQFTFPDCVHKQRLRFDFAIFNDENKLKCLIEYQGMQHYQPVNFTGKMSEETMLKNFEENQLRDSIKKSYCVSKNIPLLEISYKDDENIPEKIKTFLEALENPN